MVNGLDRKFTEIKETLSIDSTVIWAQPNIL